MLIRKANTPAYQRMKAGDKRYKAADHMGEGYGATKDISLVLTEKSVC